MDYETLSLQEAKAQRNRDIHNALIDNLTRDFRIRRNATSKDIGQLGQLLVEYSRTMKHTKKDMAAEIKRILQNDKYMSYYGFDANEHHYFFLALQDRGTNGGCWVLEPSGLFAHRGGCISTQMMADLQKPGEGRLPTAVQKLICRGCLLVGWAGQNGSWWLWQPQMKDGAEVKTLCRLFIDPQNPDMVVSGTRSRRDMFTAHDEMRDFIMRLVKAGRITSTGPLPEPVTETKLQVASAVPVSTAGGYNVLKRNCFLRI